MRINIEVTNNEYEAILYALGCADEDLYCCVQNSVDEDEAEGWELIRESLDSFFEKIKYLKKDGELKNDCEKMIAYKDLNTRAKINCMDQFVNVIYPWCGELDTATFDEIEYDIEFMIDTLGSQFWFDENGDWYDEGRKVR